MPRPTLFDHPKFHRLVHILQMPEPYVLGHLEFLWRVGYSSGNPVVGDELDIEIAAKWQGERGQFAAALVETRFLDRGEDGRLEIHDLHANAPEYVSNRWSREQERNTPKACLHCQTTYFSPDSRSQYCSDRCRKAEHRRRTETETSRTETDTRRTVTDKRRTETDGHATPAPAPAPAPAPRSKIKSVSSEAAKSATLEPAAMEFEVVGRGPKVWALTTSQIEQWSQDFPNLDVAEQCRRARAWLRAHPQNRKTATGMPKFLTSWLMRAVDNAKAPSRPLPFTESAPRRPQPPSYRDVMRENLGESERRLERPVADGDDALAALGVGRK